MKKNCVALHLPLLATAPRGPPVASGDPSRERTQSARERPLFCPLTPTKKPTKKTPTSAKCCPKLIQQPFEAGAADTPMRRESAFAQPKRDKEARGMACAGGPRALLVPWKPASKPFTAGHAKASVHGGQQPLLCAGGVQDRNAIEVRMTATLTFCKPNVATFSAVLALLLRLSSCCTRARKLSWPARRASTPRDRPTRRSTTHDRRPTRLTSAVAREVGLGAIRHTWTIPRPFLQRAALDTLALVGAHVQFL